MKYLSIILLFSCLGFSVQKSTPQDDHYVGAVVEYTVTGNVATNLANYANLIKEAADQGADIVVFPELTLTNSSTTFEVPLYGNLRDHPVPALSPDLYDEFMVTISNAALQNDIYVVINGRELLDCTVQQAADEYCPEAKQYVFNTNVVFDRTGKVIDRFRKINLFGEFSHTPALRPDLGVFETDFGVSFGHFICFDLMFQVPAVQVVQKSKVKNVIFPTMWFSELPYLTAVQIQEAYAYSLDVNFLGAGANNVRVGSAGSGIYSGKAGALISIMPGLPTTKVLVAKVPKVPGQVTEPFPGPIYDDPANHDNLKLITDPSLPSHVTRLLELGSQEFTLVDKDVSCTFKVTLAQREGNTHYRYRAGVFSGVRSYSGLATGGTRICGVFACTDEDRKSCGNRLSTYISNTTGIFEELIITATMPTPVLNSSLDTDDSIVYPVSSKVTIMPLESKDFTYTKAQQNDVTVHTMTLTNKMAELYTFAIWGRRFATDGQDADPELPDELGDVTPAPGASTVHLLSKVLFATFVGFLCFTF
ncbi:vanin-like protein 2 isoform X3 [Spodoptera frugiperda]|uniref:Vanin-like protein 2 isoform X3 n=1 Tax=Spodoptera frugiperda TaxID=7108 RepID=A0A9R0DCZ4_SPOFR|nr:vanin-like protein 2 isoform X3 [Spodoptera frugiperda]